MYNPIPPMIFFPNDSCENVAIVTTCKIMFWKIKNDNLYPHI